MNFQNLLQIVRSIILNPLTIGRVLFCGEIARLCCQEKIIFKKIASLLNNDIDDLFFSIS